MHASENAALVQKQLLAVDDAAHAHESENVTVSLAFTLTVADATHAHTSETPAYPGFRADCGGCGAHARGGSLTLTATG
jgi:hypothetical protein